MADRLGDTLPVVRVRLRIRGLVQGVGFRPFVHRLAEDLGLRGSVRNSPAGATVEIEGSPELLSAFKARLRRDKPPACEILQLDESPLEPTGASGFTIDRSELEGVREALILPDIATCPECLREIFDPADRRYRYPFTNCTRCGPRYSILESLPYDRARTAMRGFALCGECLEEYQDPADRRFHAEPVACPRCGPRLAALSPDGAQQGAGEEALQRGADLVRRGGILALKGLGGYQLLVRADDDHGVERLRRRKGREAKPLALMSVSLDEVARFCQVTAKEVALLESTAAPIVLLDRRPDPSFPIAPAVAPDHPRLGVMLPCTPLHHLLLRELGFPVVATSGNAADEPLCTREDEALRRLGSIADGFLVHDRPIVRPVDDSVVHVVMGTEQVLRRARGYAPVPIGLPPSCGSGPTVLGMGAHLKGAIAVARGADGFLSQHLGDLETVESLANYERVLEDLPRLLDARPGLVACDLHPDYAATQRGLAMGLPVIAVPHHEAHAWACLADSEVSPPALALSWDGSGLGPDGTMWGGEWLEITQAECRRRAWFRPFPLPGGDLAARDGRRCALGLLERSGLGADPVAREYVARALSSVEARVLGAALRGRVNCPVTSSVGRLFDALASVLGIADRSRYEGEAAQRLEWAAGQARNLGVPLPAPPDLLLALEDGPQGWEVDWGPLVSRLVSGDPRGQAGAWALAWHRALAHVSVEMARRLRPAAVLLTGGCFQNRLLTELVGGALREAGFAVYWHRRIPPNDGGIAFGQVVAARRRTSEERGAAAADAPRTPA